MTRDMIAIVAAASSSRGIGYKGQLPWKLPGDMAYFKRVTTAAPPNKRNAVIMGRKTWESIPPQFRPLPGRINVILTRNEQFQTEDSMNVLVAHSLSEATRQLDELYASELHSVFVIGGEQIYRQALEQDVCQSVLLTEVSNLPEAVKFDAFFPALEEADGWCLVNEKRDSGDDENAKENQPYHHDNREIQTDKKSGISYRFLKYERQVNVEEMQYLDLCRDIMENGIRRGDRTGTGTLSKFGTQMRFSLRDGTLPLLTTKRTFWRGVAEELLWFIAGNTNANDLSDKDIHIWDGNGSKDFLESRGLGHREQGDLGPVYGFQWRHFGAKYVDMHTDYSGQGFDQLQDCIDKIRNHPEDRRIIMSAWNPADLGQMALPPCHMFCQFYVDVEKNELSCQMYQRSADMGLGVPFNIASYALLTHMMAHVTGRKPGDFVHTIGDAHVYLNHVEALQEQLTRRPRPFPKLKIKKETTDIDSFVYDDFEIVGYKPHKTIKMKMAV